MVPLGKFYCSPRAEGDLPDQTPTHDHTVGHRRPIGGVIFGFRFVVNLFPNNEGKVSGSKCWPAAVRFPAGATPAPVLALQRTLYPKLR
jgi:hypothetical protein